VYKRQVWFRFNRRNTFPRSRPAIEEDWLARLTRIATKESWGSTFLQLAWTAGPVTLLAMWGGFYIGFGKSPPLENMIYFAAFTIFAGIIAVITRVASNVVKSKEADEARACMGAVINQLPYLWNQTRNLSLELLPQDSRPYETIWHILQHSHIRSTDLMVCFRMVGFEETVCAKVAEIDMYRRYGMEALAAQAYELIIPQCATRLQEIAALSPKLAHTLQERLQGISSTVRTGITRHSGFIERGFSAMELNTPDIMTPWDAAEVFTLAFELINGRRIPLISFSYSGAKHMVKAMRDLRIARGHFRDALRVRNSRIKALAALIIAHDSNAQLIPDPHAKMRDVLSACEAYLDPIYAQRKRSKEQTKLLQQAATLWSYIETAQKNLHKRSKELLAEQARYRHIVTKSPVTLLKDQGQGIKITYKSIELSDHQRLDLAEAIKPILCDTPVRSLAHIKSMATDVLLALNHMVAISTPEVQLAIETSPAPNFTSIDLDVSANTKAMWAKNVIDELERTDNSTYLADLVTRLVHYYGVTLDDDALTMLCSQFHTDKQALQHLQGLTPSVDDLVATADSLANAKIRKNPYKI
jgi:hypothetical protein